jgi:hypothetical protein
MRCSTRFIAATAVAAVSLVPLTVAARVSAQQSLPPALASFLTEEAHATSSDREALLASNPLVKLLDADPSKEIAVLGAIWVRAAGQHIARESLTRTERVPSFRHRLSARRRPSGSQRTDSKADPLSTRRDWRGIRLAACDVAAQDGDDAAKSAARQRPS